MGALDYREGDWVEKHTGDYRVRGMVVGIITMRNGAIRYAVEHEAAGGGSFVHIYAAHNLRRVDCLATAETHTPAP